MSSWKRDVASGLVVVVPIFVSIYVVAWIYWQLAKVPILRENYTDAERVAIFLAVFVLVVLAIGYLMRTTLGRVAEGFIDDAANRVPLVRVVYNASKMAAETALTGTEDLQTPVKLEPWNGMRLTAFKTGKTTEDGRDVLFMPTAPNITSGFVVEAHPDDYVETDERVEDALTRILSAGFGESRGEKGVPIEVEAEDVVSGGAEADEARVDGPEVDGARADGAEADGSGGPPDETEPGETVETDGTRRTETTD